MPGVLEESAGGAARVYVMPNARVGGTATIRRPPRTDQTQLLGSVVSLRHASVPGDASRAATATDDTQLFAVAHAYANRVHDAWPQTQIWTMRDHADPNTMRVLVVAPTWNIDLMSEAIDMSVLPDAKGIGVHIDPSVFFSDSIMPSLEGFIRLA
ncbi:MAG: hypothetical protein WCP98_06895 [Actinomycetes bacterium]